MPKQRILIVDDQDVNITLLKHLLSSPEVELEYANSGNDALEILEKNTEFDLILMDVRMPTMSGFDTVALIKENPELKDIPVIFVTAEFIKTEFAKKGYELGGYDYISKPFDKEILKNKVNVFLNLQKQKKLNIEQARELKKSNRSMRILNECNTILLYSENENEIINSFCNILVEYGNYSFVWIGKVSIIDHSKIQLIACDSINKNKENINKYNYLNISHNNCPLLNLENYHENINFHNIDNSNNNNNINYKIQTCETNNCELFHLTNCEEKTHLISIKTISINNEIYLINIYTNKLETFNSDEIDLLNSISKNMIFGLNSLIEKQNRIKYQSALFREKEELQVAIGGITDAIISAQKSGKIVLSNFTACKILDYKNEDELKKARIFDVFKIIENDIISLFNPVDLLQNSEENEPINKQYSIITNTGNNKIISLVISGIFNTNNNLEGIILVFQDITEKYKINIQNTLSQKMEAVGQLAAGIAHEINTPMQFIGDNTKFLKTSFDAIICLIVLLNQNMDKLQSDGDLTDFIQRMRAVEEEFDVEFITQETMKAIESNLNGIERISKIISAMKSFSHPSGKNKVLSDINQGIEVTATISKNEWKYDSVLDLKLDPELPPVNCILDEINQVILNMIVNSAQSIKEKQKAGSDERGLITVETKHSGDFIEIIISDNGTGIPSDKINRIFDPFFTTKEVGIGSGQGLAIAHDIIVNKHSGSINVESVLGKGTTFYVKLPLKN